MILRLRLVFVVLLVLCLCGISEAGKQHNHKKHHHKKHHGKENEPGPDDIKFVIIRETIALTGLFMCLAGSRIIKITMFTGGFILLFVFAYITLPSIIDNETCCGPNGNWMVRLGICLLAGILGGLLTLFVYYVGIFAIGGLFGMICALVTLSTPLAENDFFDTAMGVGLYYGAFIVVGGLLALLLKTVAVAAATSLGGSYAVFYGVDYWAKSNFSGGIEVLIVQMQDHIRDEFGLQVIHGHHPDYFREYTVRDVVIFTFFVLLALMGFVLQMYLARSDVKLKKIKENSCKGAHCHCNLQQNQNSDYLMEYIRSLHNSKDSIAKESLLKH